MVSDRAALDTLLESAADPVVVLDDTDAVEDCNEAARRLADVDDEWAGLSVREFFANRPELADRLSRGSIEGGSISVTADGSERCFEVTSSPIDGTGSETGGRIVRLEDVTESRERARELALNEERYHTLFESDQLVLWEQDFSEAMAYVEQLATDIDDIGTYLSENPEELGRIFDRVEVLDVNQRALDFFGVHSKSQLERNLDRLLTEESIRGMGEMWEALYDGETTFRRECEARQLDTGEHRYEILEVNVPRSEEGDYSRVYTASVDITERKRRERELERAKERYHRILDRFSDYVVICSEDAVIDYISPGVRDTLGYDPDELVGTDAVEFVHPADTEDIQAAFTKLLTDPDNECDIEYRVRTSDGSYRWVEARGRNYLADQFIEGVLMTIRDVTERKNRERTLARQNELLDEFASVVSHDVTTPLGVIENKARLIEMTGDSSHAADIYDATERVASLIDELEALARDGRRVGELETVDLATVSRDAWGTVESPDGRLTVASSTAIEADRGRLQQLLANLLSNAVEHGESGAENVALSDGAGRGGQRPGDAASSAATSGVVVRVGPLAEAPGFYVADDGPGIPEADRDTVFERGYTTGDDGRGLGLAIVERIAEGHGWSIAVHESESDGARFEIRTGG